MQIGVFKYSPHPQLGRYFQQNSTVLDSTNVPTIAYQNVARGAK